MEKSCKNVQKTPEYSRSDSTNTQYLWSRNKILEIFVYVSGRGSGKLIGVFQQRRSKVNSKGRSLRKIEFLEKLSKDPQKILGCKYRL